jgi:hypothetical protein
MIAGCQVNELLVATNATKRGSAASIVVDRPPRVVVRRVPTREVSDQLRAAVPDRTIVTLVRARGGLLDRHARIRADHVSKIAGAPSVPLVAPWRRARVAIRVRAQAAHRAN